MDGVISGQAATAAFVQGNDVSVVRFDDEAPAQSSFEAIGRIFGNCTDVEFLAGTRKEIVQNALRKSWSYDRALRLALIVLDEAEYAETKQEAALYLERVP